MYHKWKTKTINVSEVRRALLASKLHFKFGVSSCLYVFQLYAINCLGSMFIIQLLLYFFVFYVYYSFTSPVENLNSFFSTLYAFALFVCIVCFHEIFVWLSTVSFTFAGSRIGFSCHSPYKLSAKWFALVCICELDSLVLSSRSSVCGDSFNCQTG